MGHLRGPLGRGRKVRRITPSDMELQLVACCGPYRDSQQQVQTALPVLLYSRAEVQLIGAALLASNNPQVRAEAAQRAQRNAAEDTQDMLNAALQLLQGPEVQRQLELKGQDQLGSRCTKAAGQLEVPDSAVLHFNLKPKTVAAVFLCVLGGLQLTDASSMLDVQLAYLQTAIQRQQWLIEQLQRQPGAQSRAQLRVLLEASGKAARARQWGEELLEDIDTALEAAVQAGHAHPGLLERFRQLQPPAQFWRSYVRQLTAANVAAYVLWCNGAASGLTQPAAASLVPGASPLAVQHCSRSSSQVAWMRSQLQVGWQGWGCQQWCRAPEPRRGRALHCLTRAVLLPQGIEPAPERRAHRRQRKRKKDDWPGEPRWGSAGCADMRNRASAALTPCCVAPPICSLPAGSSGDEEEEDDEAPSQQQQQAERPAGARQSERERAHVDYRGMLVRVPAWGCRAPGPGARQSCTWGWLPVLLASLPTCACCPPMRLAIPAAPFRSLPCCTLPGHGLRGFRRVRDRTVCLSACLPASSYVYLQNAARLACLHPRDACRDCAGLVEPHRIGGAQRRQQAGAPAGVGGLPRPFQLSIGPPASVTQQVQQQQQPAMQQAQAPTQLRPPLAAPPLQPILPSSWGPPASAVQPQHAQQQQPAMRAQAPLAAAAVPRPAQLPQGPGGLRLPFLPPAGRVPPASAKPQPPVQLAPQQQPLAQAAPPPTAAPVAVNIIKGWSEVEGSWQRNLTAVACSAKKLPLPGTSGLWGFAGSFSNKNG